MQKTIENHFSPRSGYAYLGHQAFLDMFRQAGAGAEYCPVDIKVVAASGATPPAKQCEARLSYRQDVMARYAKLYGLLNKIKSKFWPTESAFAYRAIIAAKRLNTDQG